MKIRPYTQDDFIQILDIYAQGKLDELIFEPNKFTLIPLNQDEKRYKAFLQSQVFVYVEYKDKGKNDDKGESKVCGYVAIHQSVISSLFVHPNERGKSIGGQLLKHALNQTLSPMTLQVVSSNTPAKNLYLKQGFKKQKSYLAEYNGVDVWVEKMVYQT